MAPSSKLWNHAIHTNMIFTTEKTTGIQLLSNRREAKTLVQAAKYKSRPQHPMKEKLENLLINRLKRSSFVHNSRNLERQHLQDLPKDNLPLSPALLPTPWEADHHGEPAINVNVKCVGPRNTQCDTSKQALTLAMIDEQYPSEAWIHVYTDGSATNAVKNGGAGVLGGK